MSLVSSQRTAPESERQILDLCVDQIVHQLPPTWLASPLDSTGRSGPADADVQVRAPDGAELILHVEARRIVESRDVAGVIEKLEATSQRRSGGVGVVAARYLGPTVRNRLRAAQVSHVDATGNLWIVASSPGLFLRAQGAESDPWRGPGRPRGTLKGAAPAKVVRALLDFRRAWKIRELVEVSGASVGATYRVLEYLEAEDLVDRGSRGVVEVRSWRPLTEAWARDYDFFRAGAVSTYLAPRGLPWLLQRMADTNGPRYAVTGGLAVPADARHAQSRAAMIYVEDAPRARDLWDLRHAESGQNVLLCEAADSVAFQRSRPTIDPALGTDASVVLARPTQVAVDLMGSPGRGPEEARVLLDWMERHESAWRD
ncbi:hypothetical protein [Cellulomonas phragmiteti]|uniref:HTH iclR-type domain-containing protein n=1 Tax=Cellulomonas phragmiteti TaxID=478780 RepID=A0ABQ4DR75_9CELL|nr:hypothetical protein [Cellulomonas phragmiteti]GIG41848.1 hypothetical protein Cph01nite_36100 [Cellulomonas phragmiteti]